LRRQPIEKRKELLAKLLKGSHLSIILNEHFKEDGAIAYREACRLGCEGIVSRRIGSLYRSGRSPHWVKVKNPNAPGGEARGGGRLAVMAVHKQRKLSSRGRSPAPENRQTDSAPIRATVPLIEQYYVAVDRQLKSGFGTYEAAEKAAKE
jgi:hypothetical protein